MHDYRFKKLNFNDNFQGIIKLSTEYRTIEPVVSHWMSFGILYNVVTNVTNNVTNQFSLLSFVQKLCVEDIIEQ